MHYFASDIHLGAGTPAEAHATEHRFVAWLDRVATDAETIVLIGDIFDFWFEYRRVVPQGFTRSLAKLAELTERGIRVVLLTGNHDMWVGDYLTRECGIELYTTPQILTLGGARLFVAHGDNMKIDGDWLLKAMNATFRSRLARVLFSWLVHPDLAVRFGRWWSGNSRKRHQRSTLTEAVTEPLIAYAREHAATATELIDHYIFGHMHFPRDYRDGALHTVHLGCWEEGESYAMLDNAGHITLK